MNVRVAPLAAALALVMFASCDKNDDDNNNSSTINGMDSSFTTMAAMGNYAEISASKLADSISTDAGILEFANKMIADHQKAQDSLQLIAGQLGLYAPDSLDAEHVMKAAMLRMLSGTAFDSAYIHAQVADHDKTISLLQDEKNNGKNSSLKLYVDTYLPAVEMHSEMADSLAVKY